MKLNYCFIQFPYVYFVMTDGRTDIPSYRDTRTHLKMGPVVSVSSFLKVVWWKIYESVAFLSIHAVVCMPMYGYVCDVYYTLIL